jgi:phospholipid/cholesterol/gamma-HCH transport system permease protein
MIVISRMGAALSNGLARVGEVVVLGARTTITAPRRPLELRETIREMYAQGIRALGLLVIMAAFAGLVLTYQFGGGLVRFGARQYIGQLSSLALTSELIPILTALVLGGRIAAGIAAELGSMTATEQVDALRALGADPVKKLVVPRVVAATLVLPLFTVLGDLIGVLGGLVIARFEFGVPALWYFVTIANFLVITDFTDGLMKAAVFGFVLSLIACHAGLTARRSTEGVGRATTNAVVAGSLAVIILDYLITRMFFNQTVVGR